MSAVAVQSQECGCNDSFARIPLAKFLAGQFSLLCRWHSRGLFSPRNLLCLILSWIKISRVQGLTMNVRSLG